MKIDHNIPVIFINLDRAVERLEKTHIMLNEYGFTNVIRMSAIDNPIAPFVGCAQSHLLALQLARERGFQQVLIMEDDMEFLLPPEEFWDKMKDIPADFDVLQLVAKVFQCQNINRNDLVQLREASNAAGYVVRSHYYKRMIETMTRGNTLLETTGDHHQYANDRSWIPLQKSGKWYYFSQKIAQQRQNDWSYVSNSIVSN